MANDQFAEPPFPGAPDHFGLNFTKRIHHKPDATIDPAKVDLPEGYTVLITGAGKGVGEFIAKAYAQAKASNIIITSRTASDLKRVKGELEEIASKNGRKSNVVTQVADATKPDSYRQLKKLIDFDFGGRLDCLICNAGGGGNSKSTWGKLHDTDVDEYTEMTNLNYHGPFYAADILIPTLLSEQSKGKTLINISSSAAHLLSLSPISYNISKLALNRLTQHIAESYAEEGLHAYAIHPGATPTPGTSFMSDEMKERFLKDDNSLCGAVCVWFSKEKRPWASGRFISSNWDMEELESRKDEIASKNKLVWTMDV